MKKTIEDYDLKGKKVVIRCDFNVPMKDGKITDDNRIVASLQTIRYAMEHGAKLILLSHLGKVKTEEDRIKNTLKPVANRLSELLGKTVDFCPETRGTLLEEKVQSLQNGDILLVENTRFEDLDGKKESGNDEELGKYWASLGDLFINDAYGSSHRAHASTYGIPSYLPSGIGFLVKKEVMALESVVTDPKRPFVVIMGGAKVQDKIGVIENLVQKANTIIIGGGMAFTFLKAMGYEIGTSLLDEESLGFCKRMLKEYKEKIVLPVDVVVADEVDANAKYHTALVDAIGPNDKGVDVGEQTLKRYQEVLKTAKTVIWNGPVGVFEIDAFAKGTLDLCKILADTDAKVVVGGGDSASAVKKLGFKEKFYHISTGGGATLEYLEGKELPGIKIICDKE